MSQYPLAGTGDASTCCNHCLWHSQDSHVAFSGFCGPAVASMCHFVVLHVIAREVAHVIFPCEGAGVPQQQLRVDPLHGIPHGRRRNRQGPRRGRPRPQNHQLQVPITFFLALPLWSSEHVTAPQVPITSFKSFPCVQSEPSEQNLLDGMNLSAK